MIKSTTKTGSIFTAVAALQLIPVYAPPRSPYYGGAYLAPEVAVSGHRRSRSYSGSVRSQASPPLTAAPIIINKIYTDHDTDDDERHLHALVPPRRDRSRSRSDASRHGRSSSHRPVSAVYIRDERDYDREDHRRRSYSRDREREQEDRLRRTEHELDRLEERDRRRERELAKFREREEEQRLRVEQAQKTKLLEKEIQLQRLKADKKAEEEKARHKREKDEREREYQRRLEADMRKMGIADGQIAQLAAPGGGVEVRGPTYTRMSRKYLSIETLNQFMIDYQYDQDPECVLIKRVVPKWEQDRLWAHSKALRDSRSKVYIEVHEHKDKHHKHSEPEFQFVREKKHARKPSPSSLLTWVAGGSKH